MLQEDGIRNGELGVVTSFDVLKHTDYKVWGSSRTCALVLCLIMHVHGFRGESSLRLVCLCVRLERAETYL